MSQVLQTIANTEFFCDTFDFEKRHSERGTTMKQVVCPIDNRPCERDCPDRYIDTPEGGCFLTTAQEFGAKILDFGGGDVGMLFMPGGADGR